MIRRIPFLLVASGAIAGAGTADLALDILERSCLSCHNTQTRSSGLSLATDADARKGGKHGSALVSGDPDQSGIVKMVSGDSPKMPLGGKRLSAAEVETLRSWIREGGEWPRLLEAGWWSLKPLQRPPVPGAQTGWERTAVDAFISAKLTEKKLRPSPEADRRTLIRRLSYDLHGLPPTWDEIQAFVADKSPDAYEKLVDRLLASPRYGERWVRHWLDVVHYGESHGYDKDKPRRNAYPYRDYVIQAFNSDKPYTRFIEEQLAGDVLWPDSAEGVIATGFIAAGPWDYVGHAELREDTVDKKITRLLDRDDMVMTTISSFVSMTSHCARCHDHKFDPIKQEDYYSLQAVFAGVDRAERPYDDDPATFRSRRALLAKRRDVMIALQPLLDQAAQVSSAELEKLDADVRELRLKLTDRKDPELQQKVNAAAEQRKGMVRALLTPQVRDETDRLNASLERIDHELDALPKPKLVYAAAPFFPVQANFRPPLNPRPVWVLNRGNVDQPGKPAQPGALSCLPTLPARFVDAEGAGEGARRAALANWIAAPENMLTWRSIVNRVWEYHFGSGIVDTPNDFGRMGSRPTHPELLDWLAVEFRDSMHGSIKQLHRLIVTSSVYRQSSADQAANTANDGENRYLWRMNRRRLEAESIRDSALAISGRLNLTMGGPSDEQFWFKDDHSPVYDYAKFDVDSPASYRRSVYRFLVRSVPDPFMDRLDCADPSLLTPKRNVTITAIQALATLNNPFMVRQAEHLAFRLRELGGDDAGAQIRWMYRLSVGRDPTESEVRSVDAYRRAHGLENLCRIMLNSNEFLFID